MDPQDARRWVDLRGPDEVAKQVALAYAGAVRQVELPENRQGEWTHRLEMPRGIPAGTRKFLDLLTKVLTLRQTQRLDVAVALDWYKKVEDGVEPKDWENTRAGGLVSRGKYYRFTPWRQASALNALVELTSDFVDNHPLYANASYVLSVPGSKADGESFGERFATKVAERTGKRLILTTSKLGARAQAKEGYTTDLMGNVVVDSRIRGPVIIIDDVYRTGSSMRAVAHAARKAGATRTFGLAAVRTMRN